MDQNEVLVNELVVVYRFNIHVANFLVDEFIDRGLIDDSMKDSKRIAREIVSVAAQQHAKTLAIAWLKDPIDGVRK